MSEAQQKDGIRRKSELKEQPERGGVSERLNSEPEIVFEDEDILILNKPAGMVVNRSQTWTGVTIQDWLAERWQKEKAGGGDESEENERIQGGERSEEWRFLLPEDYTGEFGSAEEIFTDRVGIAHRLDKETSGLLLVGKNPGTLMNLLDQFKKRLVIKSYLALVHGLMAIKEDRVNLPMGRRASNRLLWAVRPDGRTAITDYQVLKEWPGINIEKLQERIITEPELGRMWPRKEITNLYQGFTLIECKPKTGRTHQIRVHLTHLHHPLVGDNVYGSARKIRLDQVWCPRQFLHAAEIIFKHPRSGEEMTVRAELPADLQSVLGFLD